MTRIYQDHGLRRGLWRAAQANILRLSLGSAAQMAAFVQMRRIMGTVSGSEDEWEHLSSSVIAATGSSIAAAPVVAALDIIKTRLYLQPVNKQGRGVYYSSILDCVRKINRTEGVMGYTKGMSIAFSYSFLNSSITLLSWEELKRFGSHSFERIPFTVETQYR